jgi:hypothetical protein
MLMRNFTCFRYRVEVMGNTVVRMSCKSSNGFFLQFEVLVWRFILRDTPSCGAGSVVNTRSP